MSYKQLRAIKMPVLEARLRLLRQLEQKFESAANERAYMLSRQGVNWGDMWHVKRITDREMKRLISNYLRYHAEFVSLRINISGLTNEVYKFTGELHTNLSVAEIEKAHLSKLRASRRSA